MSLYAQQLVRYPEMGISLDFSKLPLDDAFLSSMQGRIDKAFADMKALESGAVANPDEGRMVGHYWLRNSALAPTPELKAAIDGPLADVKDFGRDVLDGRIAPPRAEQYSAALVICIGGSALGPELVADAIPAAGLDMFFLDNTDPDGMYRVLESLPLEETLVVVISKSGGTPETRNGMMVAQDFFNKHGLDFAAQAVAVTGVGSKLDKTAEAEGWLKRFPMEDWVGGRTSGMSVVGLVPAVLQGVDVDALLEVLAKEQPQLHLLSAAGEQALEKKAAEKAARKLPELSEDAQHSLTVLRRAKDYLDAKPELSAELSAAQRRKRAQLQSKPVYRYVALAIFVLGVAAAAYGLYSVFSHTGSYGVYFALFGFAAIFLFSSYNMLPTAHNNNNAIMKRADKAEAAMAEYVKHYPHGAFPVASWYAHPIVLKRMMDAIEEGNAVTVPEALDAVKARLKSLNADVQVEQEEYDEVVVIKALFLNHDYQ